MNRAIDAVFEFEAKLSLYAVTTLSLAIYEARLFLPNKPPMSVLWAKVREKKCRRTESAIARCLDRAVKRIYESGSQKVLASYQKSWLYKKPAAHEFIYVVASKLYGGESPAIEQNSTKACENPLQTANACDTILLH